MIKTTRDALGYLLRDPSSVEAEAARVLGHELERQRSELVKLRSVITRALGCIEQAGPDQDEFGGLGPVSTAERILRGEP